MSSGIYLLCFADTPYKHAKHYCGWSDDIETRIEQHRRGSGARLMAVCKQHGIEFKVARTWIGAGRTQERKIKNMGGLSRRCPICRARAKEARK